jgi:hypothetical protein
MTYEQFRDQAFVRRQRGEQGRAYQRR